MTQVSQSARSELPTQPTGTSLQQLADQYWQSDAGQSELYFEGRRWTSAELADRTRRLSGGLRDTAGVRPGDRVVVCMANCPEVSAPTTRSGAVARWRRRCCSC
jgi:acyl-CoA synthetase (AMP-forming)/AMP-acid ligase II